MELTGEASYEVIDEISDEFSLQDGFDAPKPVSAAYNRCRSHGDRLAWLENRMKDAGQRIGVLGAWHAQEVRVTAPGAPCVLPCPLSRSTERDPAKRGLKPLTGPSAMAEAWMVT